VTSKMIEMMDCKRCWIDEGKGCDDEDDCYLPSLLMSAIALNLIALDCISDGGCVCDGNLCMIRRKCCFLCLSYEKVQS
jgi:hypothetical protein